MNALTEVARLWADHGLFIEKSFEPQLVYFRNRYLRDGAPTNRFHHLNLRNGDQTDLVRRVLGNDAVENFEIAAALLIIVYRFRNNLFHGEKWAYELQGQLENFNHANAILMRGIELHRQLPRQE